MFGTLRPAPACSRRPEVAAYRRLYCGTCQSLGTHFGLVHRALLNHDAVFMAVLADALQEQAGSPSTCRCPMNPLATRATVTPSAVAMRYAASVQLLLADQWLADRAVDGRVFARLVRPALRGAVGRANAALAGLGTDATIVVGFEGRQAALEADASADPRVAAAPTAAVLASVFEAAADLPQTVPAARTAAVREDLAALGSAVGTAIYLLDALEDLPRDAQTGAFNPCLERDDAGPSLPDPSRVAIARTALDEALTDIAERLTRLPLRRHREVLRSILVVQLGARSRRASAYAATLVEPAARDGFVAWRAMSWPRRLTVRAVAMLVFVLTWTSSLVAEAARRGPRGKGRARTAPEPGGSGSSTSSSSGGSDSTQGAGTGGTQSTGSDSAGGAGLDGARSGIGATESTPLSDVGTIGEVDSEVGSEVGSEAPPELDRGPCDGCFDSACGWVGDCFGNCCEPCGDCNKQCGSCCDGCGNCGDGCGNCGNDCGNCCNGCEGCGNDCGNCGNSCGDCGNCGNGCNNCGNC